MTTLKPVSGLNALLVAVAGLLVLAPLAMAAQQVTTTVGLPARVTATATASDCANAPGPVVTLQGTVTVASLVAELIFRNNEKGTHEATESVSATVELLTEGALTIPKQPAEGGVGGNPFIWIQFLDGSGDALTEEIFLGRCVQGLSDVDAILALPTEAFLEVEAESCTNHPGPFITLSGTIGFAGLSARIIFRNSDNPVGGPHENLQETSVDVEILPTGTTVQIPKQPVEGGVGGNPWISLVLRDGDGTALTEEILLGRCVQDL